MFYLLKGDYGIKGGSKGTQKVRVLFQASGLDTVGHSSRPDLARCFGQGFEVCGGLGGLRVCILNTES